MLYREIIAVRSEIHTKHINKPCEQNLELVHIVTAGLIGLGQKTTGCCFPTLRYQQQA